MSDHKLELADDKVLLRAFRLEDAHAVYDAVRSSFEEIHRWMPWCGEHYSLDDTRAFLSSRAETHEKEGEYTFAIVARASGQIVGATGLNYVDRETLRANLGYWVRTDATRKGYATAAARLVARLGLGQLEFQRLEIVVAVSNEPSVRVAERIPARREGIARNRLRIHGKQYDAVVFSLIPGDLEVVPRK